MTPSCQDCGVTYMRKPTSAKGKALSKILVLPVAVTYVDSIWNSNVSVVHDTLLD